MKKLPLGWSALALLVSAFFVSAPTAHAQDGDGGIVSRAISASVDYGNDAVFTPTKHDPDFDILGLDPQQAVIITVTFPQDLAGQLIIVEPLDGGTVTAPDNGFIVGSDGTVVIPFQASSSPGGCRIAVHQPDDSNVIHFWIIDPDHPENTPPNLPGAY